MEIEVYKFAGSTYFSIPSTKEEGKIVLGSANRGNDCYLYVAELQDCEEMEEERQDEIIKHLESNFELITFAKEL